MSYYNLLDKDRLLFTQCNDNFRIRCPICRIDRKFLGHCKIGRNFPSLWSHIKKDHQDIPQIQLDEAILILKTLHIAFESKIVTEWPDSITKNPVTTTSSSILIDGHLPRIDQWGKITKIANLLKNQSTFYPNYKKDKLRIFVKKASGVHDHRTIQQYFDCVTNYSIKDKLHGVYDVSNFCDTVGV